MSRGGGRGGGGRGGRGGGRGGRPNVPWDTGDEPDARPCELFPPYAVPTPRKLTTTEFNSVQHLLLLRRQVHASPLYTSKRTSLADPAAPRKTYGQAQANLVYGGGGARNNNNSNSNSNSNNNSSSKASMDPFTSMPTYSQKFVREERALPDWSRRPICRELFPLELLETIDGNNNNIAAAAAPSKKRRLELSRVSALPNAEEAFGMPALSGGGGGDDGSGNPRTRDGQSLLDKLEALRDEGGGAGGGGESDAEEDDDGLGEDDGDEIYDDEDAGDYDAEQFFDNGEDFGDEYGDGDDGGEGTY